ncbi:MAG: LapA family protein [Rhodocyclaceae bacterium]|nr:LapA family protein [Rhodocyclaceae bacterium]
MRSLIWIFRAVAFVLLLGFAIKNSGIVNLSFFFGLSWQLPLVFVMLLFFVLGAVVGLTGTFATVLSQRRELARLRDGRDGTAS